MKQMNMKKRIGTMLYSKLVQLSMWKAATNAPTNIRKMVPGPRMVPPINMICNRHSAAPGESLKIPTLSYVTMRGLHLGFFHMRPAYTWCRYC